MEKVKVLRSKSVIIQEVAEVWKTDDGCQFNTKSEAIAHEKFMLIKEKYNRIPRLNIIDGTILIMYLRGEADTTTIMQYLGAKEMNINVDKFPCYARVSSDTVYIDFGSDIERVTIDDFDAELSALSSFLSQNAGV